MRHAPHLLVPVLDERIVDCLNDILGSARARQRPKQPLGLVELIQAAGREDHACPSAERELGGAEGHAACTQAEHRLAGLQLWLMAIQGRPSSPERNGESRAFEV